MAISLTARAWLTIAILSLTYAVSFLDRQILVLLVDPIRRDLSLTDTSASLLTGFAFAIFYAVMGIPLGRVADTWSRKKLIMLGVTLWGSMTVVCGGAQSFLQLFIGRMGVGIGEAALTPAAYSMVPDLFPPERQARGMSIFALGAFVGGGLSLVFGGWVIAAFAGIQDVTVPILGSLRMWQATIAGVGLATLAVLLPLSWIRDPRPEASGPRQHMRFMDVLRHVLIKRRVYLPIFLGIPLANSFTYGMQAWMPTFFIRVHGWAASDVGIRLGVVSLASGVAGVLTGGWLADRWRRKGMPDATMRVCVAGVLATIPLPLFVVLAPSPTLALCGMALLGFCIGLPVPTVSTALQIVTPGKIRAQISALFLLVVNLVGIGFGPTAIALITDIVFQNDKAVGFSIAVFGAAANLASASVLIFGLRGFRDAAR